MQLTSAKSKFSSDMLLFQFRSGYRACACSHPFTGWIPLFGNKQSDSWDYQINQMKTDFSLKILCSTVLQLFPCKWVWQVLYNVQTSLYKQKHERAWAEIKLYGTNLEQLWGCTDSNSLTGNARKDEFTIQKKPWAAHPICTLQEPKTMLPQTEELYWHQHEYPFLSPSLCQKWIF